MFVGEQQKNLKPGKGELLARCNSVAITGARKKSWQRSLPFDLGLNKVEGCG